MKSCKILQKAMVQTPQTLIQYILSLQGRFAFFVIISFLEYQIYISCLTL